MRLAAIGLVVMVISACAKPYDPPALEQSRYGQPLQSGADSFGGLKQLSATGVRVLWVHGMCSHDERWINNRVGVISRAMSIAPSIVPQESDENSEGLITTYKFGNMTVDFLLWSSFTENIKKNLKFDDSESSGGLTGRFPYRRASVNEQIKAQLLNDCLADVAIYLNPNGHGIRKAARRALCLTFGGTYYQTESSKSNWCKNLQNPNVVFVTESLGSQIVYRELASLMEFKAEEVESLQSRSQQGQSRNQENPSSIYMDGFILSQAFTTTHFLVSNQVPLLQLGEGRKNSIQNLIELKLNFL